MYSLHSIISLYVHVIITNKTEVLCNTINSSYNTYWSHYIQLYFRSVNDIMAFPEDEKQNKKKTRSHQG